MALPSRTTRLSILIPRPVDAPFTYESETPLEPGTLVHVPLGNRMTLGAVWPTAPDAHVKTKQIAGILDFPPLPKRLLEFIDWVAAYTLSPVGEVLALTLKESLLAATPQRGKKFIFLPANPALSAPDLSAPRPLPPRPCKTPSAPKILTSPCWTA